MQQEAQAAQQRAHSGSLDAKDELLATEVADSEVGTAAKAAGAGRRPATSCPRSAAA